MLRHVTFVVQIAYFASDQINEERNKKQVFAFLATFEQLSLQKATFDLFWSNF